MKQSIDQMLDALPLERLAKVYEFVRLLSSNAPLEMEEVDCAVLSEHALAEWATKEEDDFWKDL